MIHDDKPLSHRIRETIGPYKENADPVASAWADEVEQLEIQLSSQQKIVNLWKELVNVILDSLRENE